MNKQALRVGIGGPVGSGKTALTLALCQAMREHYEIAVVTNDIYTKEDAEFLTRHNALEAERIIGVETGEGAAVRIPPSARTPPPTSPPWPSSTVAFPRSTWCSWKAAATTSPPPSAPNCRI